MKKHLSEVFLLEIFKLALRYKEVMEVVKKQLEYHYITNETHKRLWKTIRQQYELTGKIPSIGILTQLHNTTDEKDIKVREELQTLHKLTVPEKDTTLKVFQDYIKDKMSIEFYNKFADLFNKGQKEEARELMMDSAEKLGKFSVFDNVAYYERVFKDFSERQNKRIIINSDHEMKPFKVPTGIDCFDELSFGGINEGDIALFVAQSGTGKTKLLKWIALSAARRGYNVLHIQAEGTKQEAFDLYDAGWTGVPLYKIETANIDKKLLGQLKQIANEAVIDRGDIWVHAYEQMGMVNISQIKSVAEDIMRTGPKIDLIVIDYFEVIDPMDAERKRYSAGDERFRREALSVDMKNLALELGTRVITATQAHGISPERLNDPNFYMTRYNISEFKNLVKPFSYVVTLNQTEDEYEEETMRLYFDKIRKYKGKQLRIIHTAYGNERFYDVIRTKALINAGEDIVKK